MKKKKRIISIVLCLAIIISSMMIAPITAEAATTSSKWIINVYDGGKNYSGKYQITRNFGNYKGSLFGKKFTIEGINYLSQLSKSDAAYFSKYARYDVWLYKDNGNKFYKFYGGLKNGGSFTLPYGTYYIQIQSRIDSAGWKDFAKHTKNWTFAHYRLRY